MPRFKPLSEPPTSSARYPYLEKYKTRSAKVDWSPAALADADIPIELRPAILAAAVVEGETRQEIIKAQQAGLMRHEDLRRFFELWIVQEEEHARVLRFVADQNSWWPLEGQRELSLRQRVRRRASPVGLYGSRLLADATIAFLGVAAAAEYLTHTLYRAVAREVPHRDLRRCLYRISAQESTHLEFFLAAATARSSSGPIQAACVRQALRMTWRPVGMDRLGKAAWNRTFEALIAETSVGADLARMDEVLDSVAIFEGLGLMDRFLSEQRRAC